MAAVKTRDLNFRMVVGLEDKGLKEVIKDTKKFGQSVKGLADSAIKASAAFVAFRGAQAAMTFGRESVDQANALTRGVAGLATVFGDTTPQMLEFVKTSSQFGMSMAESSKAVTFLGSVLKQSGFGMEETAQLTQRLTRLATDLAITYGYDVQEALLAMTALFRGEYDPIEKFGVAMKQNEIESLKAERGLAKLTGTAEIFADQQIRTELLFKRAADAEGAYQRQSESLFVQQQQLAATFKNVQGVVGLALTPALSKLTYAMITIVDAAAPLIIKAFEAIVPVIESMVANKEELAKVIFNLAGAIVYLIGFVANLAKAFVAWLPTIKIVAAIASVTLVGARAFLFYATTVKAVTAALGAMTIGAGIATTAVRALKIALVTSGIGAIVVGLGLAVEAFMGAADGVQNLEEELKAVEEVDLEAIAKEFAGLTTEVEGTGSAMEDTAGAAGELKDAVGDFFRGLADSAAKQSAKLQLQAMGASEGLVNAVLGSGEEWYKVFAYVTRNGLQSLQEVQKMFMQTTEGFDEAMSKWQEEFDAFQDFKKQAIEAKDALVEFVTEFQILPTIQRQLGKFEQAAVDQLASIEDKLEEAFDNKQLLTDSYQNLLSYARQEFAVLTQIERQRDEILARRDAAEALINSVSDSVRSGAQLVNVLQNVQNATDKVDVASVVKKTVADAAGLREFSVIVTSAVVEPIEEVVSKSQQLVSGYRDIVERTRAFVANMKELRALGLDPQLFQQLVEAGVDAGGATAQALIEGGADTVNEVNSLFGELNDLGTQLGEETAQVMYGQGENFVDGIVAGLEAQAAALEEQAVALAEAFTTSFEDILIQGIKDAIAAARAELAKMPRFNGQPQISDPGPDTGTGTGTGSSAVPFDPSKPTTGGPIGSSGPANVTQFIGTSGITSGASNWRPSSFSYAASSNMYTAPANVVNNYISGISARQVTVATSKALTSGSTSSSRSSTSLRIP